MRSIKVLIIDDSALIRRLLSDILSTDPEIEVVGTASDPIIAREKIKKLLPDVLTLDIEMPRMDGLTFLEKLMRLHPMPVIMVSTRTENGAQDTMRALSLGAIDFIPKPKVDIKNSIEKYTKELIRKVKIAGKTSVSSFIETNKLNKTNRIQSKTDIPKAIGRNTKIKLVAIGASTGGTEAILEVLKTQPIDAPPIVITQHIPSQFSNAFAERLNRKCHTAVCEAKNGQVLENGHAYIAPGGKQLKIVKAQNKLQCKVFEGEPVNHHCPSVDVLFTSISQSVQSNTVCIMLTGMGRDGANGMEALYRQGNTTIAQDEYTSVVWGMPGEVVKRGCTEYVLPLNMIGPKLVQLYIENTVGTSVVRAM